MTSTGWMSVFESRQGQRISSLPRPDSLRSLPSVLTSEYWGRYPWMPSLRGT